MGGEATTFLFFLDLDDNGFRFFGGEGSVATGEGGWSGCLVRNATTSEVAIEREPIVFEIGNLGRGELG